MVGLRPTDSSQSTSDQPILTFRAPERPTERSNPFPWRTSRQHRLTASPTQHYLLPLLVAHRTVLNPRTLHGRPLRPPCKPAAASQHDVNGCDKVRQTADPLFHRHRRQLCRDCNHVPLFPISGFGTEEVVILGSRQNYGISPKIWNLIYRYKAYNAGDMCSV